MRLNGLQCALLSTAAPVIFGEVIDALESVIPPVDCSRELQPKLEAISRLTAELATRDGRLREFETQLTAAVEKANEAVAAANENGHNFSQCSSALADRQTALDACAADAVNFRNAAEVELANIKDILRGEEERVRQLDLANQQLNRQVEHLSSSTDERVKSLERNNDELNAARNSLIADFNSCVNQQAKIEEDRAVSDRKVTELTSQIKQLTDSNRALENKIKQLEDSKKRVELTSADVQRENAQLKRRVDDLLTGLRLARMKLDQVKSIYSSERLMEHARKLGVFYKTAATHLMEATKEKAAELRRLATSTEIGAKIEKTVIDTSNNLMVRANSLVATSPEIIHAYATPLLKKSATMTEAGWKKVGPAIGPVVESVRAKSDELMVSAKSALKAAETHIHPVAESAKKSLNKSVESAKMSVVEMAAKIEERVPEFPEILPTKEHGWDRYIAMVYLTALTAALIYGTYKLAILLTLAAIYTVSKTWLACVYIARKINNIIRKIVTCPVRAIRAMTPKKTPEPAAVKAKKAVAKAAEKSVNGKVKTETPRGKDKKQ